MVAVLNGGFREVVLIPRVGEYAGHVLSTALLVGATLVVSAGYFRWTPVSATLGQYDVLAGQVWVAVPLTLLASPLVFGWCLAP